MALVRLLLGEMKFDLYLSVNIIVREKYMAGTLF